MRECDVSVVSAWQSLTDGKRMELVQRFHHLKDMRDKTMDRLDLIGYARLKESARFKGVCDVILPHKYISNVPVDVLYSVHVHAKLSQYMYKVYVW